MSWKIKILTLIVLSLSPFFPASASGASLFLKISKVEVLTGENLAVGVYASSDSEAMNAASGALTFPKDKLEVISVSKGSLFNFWLKEPSFSNSGGTVNFEGIILNPGYKGKAGKIITVTFKAKSAGSARLSFAHGEILANDGKGTDILSGLGKIDIKISSPDVTAPAAEKNIIPMPAKSLGAPAISSSTPLLKPSDTVISPTSSGNIGTSSSAAVEKLSLKEIKAAFFKEWPSSISSDEYLRLRGKAPAYSKITILIDKDSVRINEYEITSGNNGRFMFITDKLAPGNYVIMAQIVDDRAKTAQTDKISVRVEKPAIGKTSARLLLFIGLLALSVLFYRYFTILKKRGIFR